MIYSILATLIGLMLIASGRKKANKRSKYTDFGIGTTLLAIASVNAFVLSPYKVPSESMYPVLKVGDYILVKKWGIGNTADDFVGKVIVYRSPSNGDTYVKRIVAEPGDTISWDGNNLKVDQNVIATYKSECHKKRTDQEALYAFMNEDNVEGEWTVKEGVFAVGTNICKSMDSRAYGEIPINNIIGTVIGVCGEQGCQTIEEARSIEY